MGNDNEENKESLFSTLAKQGVKEAWKRLPVTLKLKILGGLAIALFVFIIINVFISMNPFDFLDFSKTAKNDYDNSYSEYWIEACNENNCSEEERKIYEKVKKSQEKFYDRLNNLVKKNNLNDEQKYIILTTLFFNYSIDEFYDGESGAYTMVSDDNFSPEIDENSYSYNEAYKEETDTLRELVKQFKAYVAVCEPNQTATESSSENNQKSYNLKDSSGKDFNFTFLEYIKYNISSSEPTNPEYAKAASKCNGNINIKKSNSSDNFYKYLHETDYLDKRKNYKSYYIAYAEANNLNINDLENWVIEDKQNVRTMIIDEIKAIIEEYTSNTNNLEFTNISYNNLFWWPIGSDETNESNGITYASGEPSSTVITSYFGYRILNGSPNNHGGVDLVGKNPDAGATNIIAARSGTVTKVVTVCISGVDMSCGGSYGNYIMILHPDGLYTLYAHIHQDTITVKEGDTVNQGQVIAKVGNSGHSYGAHLHFEVRLNADISSRTDPLQYIDPSNPRPISNNSDLVTMLNGFEGGNNVVVCNPDDVPTVGHGITLTYKYEYFAKYGYPLTTDNDYYNYCGQTFPEDLLDAIYADLVTDYKNGVMMEVSSMGFTLTNNQIDALVSLKYNCGNLTGFKDAYLKYGNTDAICTNWWINKASGGTYSKALHKRREKECKLFVYGIYDGSYE